MFVEKLSQREIEDFLLVYAHEQGCILTGFRNYINSGGVKNPDDNSLASIRATVVKGKETSSVEFSVYDFFVNRYVAGSSISLGVVVGWENFMFKKFGKAYIDAYKKEKEEEIDKTKAKYKAERAIPYKERGEYNRRSRLKEFTNSLSNEKYYVKNLKKDIKEFSKDAKKPADVKQ